MLAKEELHCAAGLLSQQKLLLEIAGNSLIGDRQMSLDEALQSVAAVDQLELDIARGSPDGGPDAVLVALGHKFDALAAELAKLQKQEDPYCSADLSAQDCGRELTEVASLERIEAVLRLLDPIERAIMTIPARTVVGLGVKARHAAHVLSNYWTDVPEQLNWDARTVRLLIESACSVAGVGLLPLQQ